VLALLLQALHSLLFPPLNYDFVVQASAAQSSLDGAGYSTASVAPDGRIIRTVVTQWPPAYSWAFAAALRLLGDPIHAAFAIELVAVAMFFAAWWYVFRQLDGLHKATLALLWLYWAVACSPVLDLPPSDVVSLALYSAALAMIVAAVRRPRGVWWFAIAGTTAGAAAAVRYAYWPLVCVPIAALAFVIRSRATVPRVAAYFIAALAPLAWTVTTNVRAAGAVTNVDVTSNAWPYWRQIARVPPFGAAPLGIDAAWSRLAASAPSIKPWLAPALWVITILVVAVTTIWLHASMKSGDTSADRRAAAFAGAATALLTMALVTALTLAVPAYRGGWTYADDLVRYLVPIYPFALLALIDHTFANWKKPVSLLLAALLAVSGGSVVGYRLGRLVYYVTRNREAFPSGPQRQGELLQVFRAVRSARATGQEVLYCDTDLTRQSIATIAGAAAMRGGCDPAGRDRTTAGQTISADVGSDGLLRLQTATVPPQR
jgi:hypothetical protein